MGDAIAGALDEFAKLITRALNAPWQWQVAGLAFVLLVTLVVTVKRVAAGWLVLPVLGAAIYWAWVRFRGY
jgi:hypothetical protein